MKYAYMLFLMSWIGITRPMEVSDEESRNSTERKIEILKTSNKEAGKNKKRKKKHKQQADESEHHSIDISESSSFETISNSPERNVSQEDLNKLKLDDYDKLMKLVKDGKKQIGPEIHADELSQLTKISLEKAKKKLQAMEEHDNTSYVKLCELYVQLQKYEKKSQSPDISKKKKDASQEKRYSQSDVDIILLRTKLSDSKKEVIDLKAHNEYLESRIAYLSKLVESAGIKDYKKMKYKFLTEALKMGGPALLTFIGTYFGTTSG